MNWKPRRITAIIFMQLLNLLIPIAALAAGNEQVPAQQPVELPSVAGLFFRILASLALILILTYVVLNIVKKQHDLRQNQKGWVRVFDYQALGPNRGLYLVELYGSVYILGVTEGQINLLKEINTQDEQWTEIQETLANSSEVPGAGLEKMLEKGLEKLKFTRNTKQNNFQNHLDRQLSEQMNRVQNLYHQTVKEDKKGE